MRRNSYRGGRWYQRPNDAYARTSGWPTRYYQRKVGGSVFTALAGLNTTSDDFQKKEGESPYLWNARLNGTKEPRKRAQSMSRMGQKFFCLPDGAETTTTASKGDLKVEISEERSVKWKLKTTGRLTQVGLRFAFDAEPTDTNAHFVLIIRNTAGKELCRATEKVTTLYQNAGEEVWFRLIRTLPAGNVTLEATLVDDFDDEGNPTEFSMYILANGTANHYYAIHELPNLDDALREKAYEWKRGVNYPATSYKTTNWETFPVWCQKGYFNAGGARYIPLGVKHDGKIEIYKVKYSEIDADTGEHHNLESGTAEIMIPENTINSNATQVRMAQAGNELFFVDGYSELKKVNLDDWTVNISKPDVNDVDTFGFTSNYYYYAGTIIVSNGHFQSAKEDFQSGDTFDQSNWEELDDGSSLTAWPGASLIYFLNNRLMLAGFRHDTVGVDTPKAEPNLIIMSSIDSVKPRYDMYNRSVEFFYVPDRAPSMSAAAPITAFSSIGDYLLVHTADGLVVETIQSAVEFAGISQTIPEGCQYGVLKQEHVVIGPNNVYFYNPTMGIMRTAGSTATAMSGPVDSFFDDMSEAQIAKSVLVMTGDVLRFYYPNQDDAYNNEALVDYVGIAQHKSYWYRDQNTPASYVDSDLNSEMYLAVGSEYPVVFTLDDGLRDFSCAILYEYYTKYVGTPDHLDHTIVRRIHLTTLQTYQSSIFVGLDYDHNNKPIVWRKFISPVPAGTFEPEDIFGDDSESGATNLDIRILTDDTRFVQIRMKQYCYDFQAEILQVGFEYANRTVL